MYKNMKGKKSLISDDLMLKNALSEIKFLKNLDALSETDEADALIKSLALKYGWKNTSEGQIKLAEIEMFELQKKQNYYKVAEKIKYKALENALACGDVTEEEAVLLRQFKKEYSQESDEEVEEGNVDAENYPE